ncbi:MAG: hypothetical protein DRN03_04905 [Thermoplasmata archaeon]|nr:MAG: hypothetical protein DRN03_04905 [Thermoplasmata archaeon]
MSYEEVRREIEEKLRRRLKEELERRGLHDDEACAWLRDEEALKKVRKAFGYATTLGVEVGFPLCGRDRKPGDFVYGEEAEIIIEERKCPAGVPMTGFFHVHPETVETNWLNEYFSTSDLFNTFLRGQKGYTECIGYIKGGKMYVKCFMLPEKEELLRSNIPRLVGRMMDLVKRGRGLLVEELARKFEYLMQKVEKGVHVCVVEVK